ncbi:MAG: adenine deaminase [Phycisphaerales bacterium]|nr:MAG: adenine deaminase [Phycisphaerales bacterium]
MSTPGKEVDVTLLQRRMRVALGQEPGDLLLKGGHVVNVFTGQTEPANVLIADGWIAGVGPYDWTATEELSLSGEAIIPGLIDAHMHLESTLLMPAELARVVVPHGTTTVLADPHEIGNVAGVAGIKSLIDASESLPLEVFFLAPSCVPASKWESAGAELDHAAVAELLGHPRVIGLAEVMNFPGVLDGNDEVLRKVLSASSRGLPVDGHAPGLSGQELIAYVAAGVRSDHESFGLEEAHAKADLGMLVQVREGSSARNLDTMLPLLVEDRLGDWCLATDDIHVDDLIDHGHLDGLLRRIVAAGVPAARAVRHATLVPARHYRQFDRGAVAPGYRADLFVVEDLVDFAAHSTIKDGEIAARSARPAAPAERPSLTTGNTIHLGPLDRAAFELRPASDECPVIGIIPDSIVTKHERRAIRRDAVTGCWVFDPKQDVALVACIERHHATGRVGVGLVSGFGFKRGGALGSSVAHDAHNLMVTGTNPADMMTCVRALEEMGGGYVAVSDGTVVARLPLQMCGLVSTLDFRMVRGQLDGVAAAARGLGCPLAAPFGTLSFLGLSVIPELRITDRGVFDVSRQQIIAV